jgi:hypothetical protein
MPALLNCAITYMNAIPSHSITLPKLNCELLDCPSPNLSYSDLTRYNLSHYSDSILDIHTYIGG